MSSMDFPDTAAQIAHQERKILELRAQLAESQRDVARKEAYILRLERRYAALRAKRKTPKQKAEAVFNGE